MGSFPAGSASVSTLAQARLVAAGALREGNHGVPSQCARPSARKCERLYPILRLC
jgi:hypothetical protein